MADIGSTLREARMRERIDISEVEARTKIRAKYLRAIENEEWDLLPGSVYAKSFLRTYGDFLGLDSRMLIDEFKRRYESPSDHEIRPATSIARERERRRPRFPSWAPIAIVVLVILGVLYAVGSATQSGPSSSSANKPKRAHRPHHHATPAVRVPTVSRPTNVTLQLVPTSTVYVCLVNGAGAKLINERTFTTADKIPTQTAPQLLLTLGNNAVQMKVDGKPVPVAASPTAIRLLLTPTGIKPIPFSQKPTCP